MAHPEKGCGDADSNSWSLGHWRPRRWTSLRRCLMTVVIILRTKRNKESERTIKAVNGERRYRRWHIGLGFELPIIRPFCTISEWTKDHDILSIWQTGEHFFVPLATAMCSCAGYEHYEPSSDWLLSNQVSYSRKETANTTNWRPGSSKQRNSAQIQIY